MFARFPRAGPFILGSASACILAGVTGLLSPPTQAAPVLQVEEPAPVVVPVVKPRPLPTKQVEAPPPVERSAKRVKRPRRRRAVEEAAPEAPPAPPPVAAPKRSRFRARLAQIRSQSDASAKFNLALEIDRAAGSLEQGDAGAVQACIAQFHINAKLSSLEQCITIYEKALE